MSTQDNRSELDLIFDKLKTDAANARASCTERKNWEDYNGKYGKFEYEAKQAIEAYVTTRVKEAERLARIKHKLDELSLVPEHPDADLKVYKENRRNELRRIAALTTTTNGKEE